MNVNTGHSVLNAKYPRLNGQPHLIRQCMVRIVLGTFYLSRQLFILANFHLGQFQCPNYPNLGVHHVLWQCIPWPSADPIIISTLTKEVGRFRSTVSKLPNSSSHSSPSSLPKTTLVSWTFSCNKKTRLCMSDFSIDSPSILPRSLSTIPHSSVIERSLRYPFCTTELYPQPVTSPVSRLEPRNSRWNTPANPSI